jgi:arylsulfatase A-like enzyme
VRLLLLLLVAACVAAGCGDAERPAQAAPTLPVDTPSGLPTATPTAPAFDITRPNIVFVLVDDMSTDLLRFMPNVQALEQRGTSFNNYIVSDSLCCPSRASIFTGQLPHNTGVFTNIYPNGGVYAYAKHDNARKSFARPLSERGYRTALMGKYLNGYRADSGVIPEGWTDWAATARGYQGFDYTLNVNGNPIFYGEQEEDYLTDVIARRGGDFIDSATARHQPFFLELATFTPHRPAVPAPRHVGMFQDVDAPRGPSFNKPIVNAPKWLRGRPARSQYLLDRIDARYRNRARSVVSADEMVGKLVTQLEDSGQLANTIFVFSSDNGYHMGEHRLLPGKLTAFDTDIRVPLIVAGPGITQGARVDALAQNIDLKPTFEQLAGAPPQAEVDGRSLVGLLQGQPAPPDWRAAALVEHRHTSRAAHDPDEQSLASGDPPSYGALRTLDFTYVEYKDGQHEYYDLRFDPDQMRNLYPDLSRARRRALHRQLRKLVKCDGQAECATAPVAPAAPAATPTPPPRRDRRR